MYCWTVDHYEDVGFCRDLGVGVDRHQPSRPHQGLAAERADRPRRRLRAQGCASSTCCGIAESVRSASNSCWAASESHTTTEPESLLVNSPMGTVMAVVDPCSAQPSRARFQTWSPLSTVSEADRGVRHRVPAPRVEPDQRAARPVQQRGHELPLVDHPVEVGARCRAGADVAQRVAPVEGLAAGGQIDAGQRIVDRVGGTDVDAAERVDQSGEAVEADLHVVVEAQSGGFFDGLGQQRRATLGEGRVDLVLAVAGDVHIGVAGHRHHRGGRSGSQPRDVDQQDRVGAAVAHVAAGGQLGLLLGGQALPAVRTDEQPGGAGRRPAAGRRSR